MPADERRDLTVRTVLDLCGRDDPARVTMASIAAAMGVTQGALFRHFRGKADIWQAVVEWIGRTLMNRADDAVASTSSPSAALEALFMSHIEFVTQHPGAPRIVFGELQQARPTPARRTLRTLLARYRERLATLLARGRDEGDFAGDLNVDAAAVQFIGAIQGLVVQSLVAGDVAAVREQAPHVLRIYMRGLRGGKGEAA